MLSHPSCFIDAFACIQLGWPAYPAVDLVHLHSLATNGARDCASVAKKLEAECTSLQSALRKATMASATSAQDAAAEAVSSRESEPRTHQQSSSGNKPTPVSPEMQTKRRKVANTSKAATSSDPASSSAAISDTARAQAQVIERGLVARVQLLLDIANPHVTLSRLEASRQSSTAVIPLVLVRLHLEQLQLTQHIAVTRFLDLLAEFHSLAPNLAQLNSEIGLLRASPSTACALQRNLSSWRLRLALSAQHDLHMRFQMLLSGTGECMQLFWHAPQIMFVSLAISVGRSHCFAGG